MKTIPSSRRHHYMAIVSIFLIVLTMAALIAGMVGCGGGSAIEIRTWYDLNAIRGADNLTKNYVLMNDLDSTTAGYEELASPTANGGKGWDTIGEAAFGSGVFFGTFDGNHHKICDLFIYRPDENDVGLFAHVGQGLALKGVIKNLGLVNCTVTGGELVGGLVGASYVANTVTNCYATGTVTGTEYVGGLMGSTQPGSFVSNSYFTGNVTGGGSVGGLVGWSNGTVSRCWATGSVTGGGSVGGLVGSNQGGTVSNSYSTGSVTGGGSVGGLVGDSSGTVSSSYATGNVTGSQGVGGLAGGARNVSNCYATGNVTGTGRGAIGGLVGWHTAGTVSNCYATGSVAGNYSGGLVGVNGNTWLSFEPMALSDTVAIYYSYSTGSVTGSICVGGLVGENYLSTAVVSYSYSTGSAAGNNMTGGLVGLNAGNVTESYATGGVTGNYSVGGLVGANWYTVSNCFWDTETSGQNVSAGGTGKTTAEMQDIDTFSGATWDITAVGGLGVRNPSYIWNIVDNVDYPFLSWQPV
jgi:hypothetical protein